MSIPPRDRANNHRPDLEAGALVAELRALREECRTLRRRFDEFARVYLNARFPYGKPTDRWRPRG